MLFENTFVFIPAENFAGRSPIQTKTTFYENRKKRNYDEMINAQRATIKDSLICELNAPQFLNLVFKIL